MAIFTGAVADGREAVQRIEVKETAERLQKKIKVDLEEARMQLDEAQQAMETRFAAVRESKNKPRVKIQASSFPLLSIPCIVDGKVELKDGAESTWDPSCLKRLHCPNHDYELDENLVLDQLLFADQLFLDTQLVDVDQLFPAVTSCSSSSSDKLAIKPVLVAPAVLSAAPSANVPTAPEPSSSSEGCSTIKRRNQRLDPTRSASAPATSDVCDWRASARAKEEQEKQQRKRREADREFKAASKEKEKERKRKAAEKERWDAEGKKNSLGSVLEKLKAQRGALAQEIKASQPAPQNRENVGIAGRADQRPGQPERRAFRVAPVLCGEANRGCGLEGWRD
ncbi:hypothetical protein DXG01_003510 [Tephrocybe rancida]|nr:hypothetical protein DXG01_003510 [Tephrocybe rancida]